MTFTTGGLAVGPDMRVQRRAAGPSRMIAPGGPIDPGQTTSDGPLAAFRMVFAAGVDVGSLSAGGYLGGLSSALVTGRIAGTNAADRRRD